MRRATEIAIATLCTAGVCVTFWSAAAWTPLHDWNGARFYPAYLLAAGEPIYHSAGAGVVNGWIYGPLLPLLLAPATWIPDPSWAMVAAGWINILVLVGPVILIMDAVAGASLPFPRRWLLGLAAAGALILVPTTATRLVFITCDQLAIGLGCLSCLALHRADAAAGWRAPLWAASLAGAALWTKQTEALLPVAQLIFLWTRRSRQAAGRYAWCVVATQAAWLLAMGAGFGWSALWLNLAWIPLHHPFAPGELGLAGRTVTMLAYATPCVVTGLWILLRRRRAPSSALGSAPLAEQFLIVGAVLMPAGVLAAAKTGGNENSFHFVYFFALAAAVAAENGVRHGLQAHPARVAGVAAACIFAAAVLMHPKAPLRLSPAPQLQRAIGFAATEPGHVIFPRNPLVTWITERKQYHHEWGLFDRALAGLPLSQADFWSGMPAQLRHAVYPVTGTYFFMQLFPAVRLEVELPDLAIYAVGRPTSDIGGLGHGATPAPPAVPDPAPGR